MSDGKAAARRYFHGMNTSTSTGRSSAIAAAACAVAGLAAWAAVDRLTDQAVKLGYAARSAPPIVATSPTLWGWLALALVAAGGIGLTAATCWAAVLWRGFATGWVERAVPVVPVWAARAAAASAAAALAVAGAVAVGAPAAGGIATAVLTGYAAAEYADELPRALTVRALIVQTVDPLLGWPGPGAGRVHRVRLRAGVPTCIELRTGPGWSPDALMAVIDAADRSPAAVLAGLTWGFDARRRLVVAAAERKD
ncbi:hypothetical protein [Mycolicibacterium iranicum]|uniref:Uncharacterized protein n=1 Tax=Mycolicibacterium iranicum TaxID=912594 RepID=A0ABT4HS43_MYCIR|nr:hypothetical protein [Mycolicibacterium iranicum]MCZ0732497.1 hypothetical protein [Mycolicibacterium iranicum]